MRRAAIVLIMALAGACSAARLNKGAADGTEATGTNAATLAAASDCPEEELSCGRQRPIVSDGVTPFVNENYYLSMVFPRGDRVCMTRSGNAPHGFFAQYGDGLGCQERPERSLRFISLYADFNTLFHADVAQALPAECGAPSPETVRRLNSARLGFPGFPSMLCETRAGSGAIELSLYTLAGPWWEGETPGSQARKATYFMALGTTTDHFDEDLARFRRVLASVRISTREAPDSAIPPSGRAPH